MNQHQLDLQDALQELAALRIHLANVREAKREIIQAAQATLEYKQADAATTDAEQTVEKLEAAIRAQGLELYNADCALPDKLTAKNFTVVKIVDPLKAKEWSIAHFTPALKLDEKVFEKAAKDGNIPADLATVERETRIQIATQL